MNNFKCPVCGEPLSREEHSFVCINRHVFDISKRGYVNLLLTNKKSHGDDKTMVKARSAFLDGGYYAPLKEALCGILQKYLGNMQSPSVLDAGCGECYYTEGFLKNNPDSEITGIDLSKDAVDLGARRDKRLSLAVASVNSLPVFDSSYDAVVSVFAPLASDEFARVLKEKGLLVRVYPLARHLWQLKEFLYENAYENEEEADVPNDFSGIETQKIKSKITLEGENIFNLFTMTPYYYRTSEKNVERLRALERLETDIEFGITVFSKNHKS